MGLRHNKSFSLKKYYFNFFFLFRLKCQSFAADFSFALKVKIYPYLACVLGICGVLVGSCIGSMHRVTVTIHEPSPGEISTGGDKVNLTSCLTYASHSGRNYVNIKTGNLIKRIKSRLGNFNSVGSICHKSIHTHTCLG